MKRELVESLFVFDSYVYACLYLSVVVSKIVSEYDQELVIN